MNNNPILRIKRRETQQDAPFKEPRQLGWYTLEDCTSRFGSIGEALDYCRNQGPQHVYKIVRLKVQS